MFGKHWWWSRVKQVLAAVLVVVVGLTSAGCEVKSKTRTSAPVESAPLGNRLTEVAPPEIIQSLRPALEVYQPQVKILSPRADEVFQSDRLVVRFQVKDLPLYKDEELGLGPHLHVFLDNRPYQAVYNANEPLVLEGLEPGTHTLRVFASRPWHESFKNEGSFAQTTFHVYTKTPDNVPDRDRPLLTYSRPQGSYGAEPILLDFYLTNAPLHLIAQERSDDDIKDWKIRCTVNGESFTFNTWEPIYLKGLKPGKNWVQLELLDENNTPFDNRFNNTVRIVTYEPGGDDTLSKLVRGELTEAIARQIVDPNYEPPAPEPLEPSAPAATESEQSEPERSEPETAAPEAVEPEPLPPVAEPEAVEEPPSPEPSIEAPVELPVEPVEEAEPDEPQPPTALEDTTESQGSLSDESAPPSDVEDSTTAEPITEPEPAIVEPELEPTPAIAPSPQPSTKPRGFFDRFRPTAKPVPIPAPEAAPIPVPLELENDNVGSEIPLSEPENGDEPDSSALPATDFEVPDFEEVPLTPKATFEEIPSEELVDDASLPEVKEPTTNSDPNSEAIAPHLSKPARTPSPQSPVRQFFSRFRRSAPAPQPIAPPPLEPAASEIPEVIDIPEPVTDMPQVVEPESAGT